MSTRPLIQIVAGLGATAIAYMGFKDSWGAQSHIREVENDAFIRSSDYHFTRGINAAYSGNGEMMDNAATGWKRFWLYGPFDIKIKLHHLKNQIGSFVGNPANWVFTALGLGGLYSVGLKPHQWVAKTGKFIWDTNILQTVGTGIKALWNKGRVTEFALKGLQQLPKLGAPGLILAGVLGWMGMRFFDTVSGEAQREHFRGTVWGNTNYWPGAGDPSGH